MKVNKRILAFSLILILVVAPYIGKAYFGEQNYVEVEYFSNNIDQEDNVVDRVLIYEYDELGLKIESGSFEYEEEKERYESTAVELKEEGNSFKIWGNSFQYIYFEIAYRLIDNDAVVSNEGIRISRYESGVLKNQREILFRDFYLYGSGRDSIGYGYYPLFSLRVFWFYSIFGIICYFALLVVNRICNKKICKCPMYLWIHKCLKSDYLYIWVFSLFCFKISDYLKSSVYLVSPDTITYCIDSFENISWFCRMPVYQLFLLGIKKIVGQSEWTAIFPYVVYIQIFAATISVLFLYDAAKKILKKKYLSVAVACVYAVLIAFFGYTENILTESLATSLMCVMLWCITQVIEASSKRLYIIISCAMVLLCIFERPSFLFLLPLLAVFFTVFIVWERRWDLIKCVVISFGVCLLVVFAYCKHNEALTGHFMLSNIAYHNQISIMLDNDMWMNSKYPEISFEAQQRVKHNEQNENGLASAEELCARFGYKEMSEYLKDCRKIYRKRYVKTILSHSALEEPVIDLYMSDKIVGRNRQFIFEIIRTSFLPFSYATMLIFIVIELIYGFAIWIREKRLVYMSFGIPGCLLGIYVTSVISLFGAKLQRYAIHMLPLLVLLIAMEIDHLLKQLEK